ncbi:DUF4159 domain-containing protein [Mesorhizobium sp. YR577]|uniref:DUF4159 domain-containing protein n=1 Tax=Mesorhizobium sp. YR577 TaxID=1884373 RepID=UPI0008F3985E|nr:DUF4159 domain-containing protein [Mesorhizobium sp. YR577]SFU20078.1 N-terminal double-transmembrane domain-containing protein [Mesorhizobium sp. YR577]
MSWLPLSFGFPAILWGLLALPVIWWLLRLTPPKPQTEVFPPLKILARVLKREETPHQSPWWLTLLRLLMAALVVMALAEPVFNPREKLPTNGSALALVIDNDWASAPDWDRRVATAERLIGDANSTGVPVLLAFTAEKPNAEIGPFDADAARDKLRATKPRPVPTDRPAVYARVAAALEALPGASVAILADGLAAQGDEAAFNTLLGKNPADVVWVVPDRLNTVGLKAAENQLEGFALTAIRPPGDAGPRQVTAGAFDDKGRRIADAALTFGAGETTATGQMQVPFELRNDFAAIAIDGENQAGAVRVLDESSKRRRVGLLSQSEADQAQPLLSPLYYIRRALEPFADLVEPRSPDLADAIPQLLDQKPAMIVMADVGTIPDAARQKLIEWVDNGGTLVRFAGSRLAAAGNDEELLPVRLRLGERSLGGALSWTEPQAVAEFPAGPFADLTPPSEVTVSRQVLAEPTADIVERTWASLADGTPLVTGAKREKGTVVLFHITPEATWSNLPISGSFVEMLRRLVQLSRNQGSAAANAEGQIASLAPYRMIAANGALVPPTPDARPLTVGQGPAPVTIENPPGLYGSEEGVVAHNLLGADAAFTPLVRPQVAAPVTEMRYAFDESRDLKGPLVAAALLLMLLDTLAVFWMGGMFNRRRKAARAAGSAAVVLLAAGAMFALSSHAMAQDAKPGDAEAIEAVSTTRLAYVLTGDASIDAISRAGLDGLSRFLIDKTALEPGKPAGVDIAKDELSFYPIIYWPIDPNAAMPTEQAIARIDAYMQQGGTVLFDTRDQYSTGIDAGSASPATERLRDILGNLNVPPLEPVPADHVLTKSFFILPDFPGRFNGSPLWVEASAEATNPEHRPVRTGDGVTPIMITANDFAGAWAIDANGEPMLPTVPADPMQRIYAYRAGVNIVMYMLTGNYKSDQVHVPVLLERLGQ